MFYRFKEPQLTGKNEILQISAVDTIEIIYEDGLLMRKQSFWNPKQEIFISISKREEQVGLYNVPYPFNFKDKNNARRIASLPLSWVTAADLSNNGKLLLVKTYTGIYRYKIMLDDKNIIISAKKPKLCPILLNLKVKQFVGMPKTKVISPFPKLLQE